MPKTYPTPGSRVIDLDTGKSISGVIWVDIESGFLEMYQTSPNGSLIADGRGGFLTHVAEGRFKYVAEHGHTAGVRSSGARPGSPPRRVVMGAPRCAKCPSTLTLPGDELCPACRSRERAQRHPMRCERLSSPLIGTKCGLCTRDAEFIVGDEVGVTPSEVHNGPSHAFGHALPKVLLFDRGATVGRRYFCSWHYKPPRLLDPKGEVIQDLESSIGPQW